MERIEGRNIPLEQYFLRRLQEEAQLAKVAPPGAERTGHLRTCKLLRELLQIDRSPDFHLRHDA